MESVRKTRRLIVVDNGWLTCGASAEIAAVAGERLEGHADIRIRRMGFAPVTCPTSPTLEEHFYPNAREIAALAHRLVRGDAANWVPEERADAQVVEFKGPF